MGDEIDALRHFLGDEFFQQLAHFYQCGLTLFHVFLALIYRDDALRHVIQSAFDNARLDAQVTEPGGKRPPQLVGAPAPAR